MRKISQRIGIEFDYRKELIEVELKIKEINEKDRISDVDYLDKQILKRKQKIYRKLLKEFET